MCVQHDSMTTWVAVQSLDTYHIRINVSIWATRGRWTVAQILILIPIFFWSTSMILHFPLICKTIIKQFVYTVWHLFFSSRIFLDRTLLIKNFHYYITGTYQSEATWNILKHSLPIKCTAWSILLPIKISNCCSDSYFILQQIAYAFLLSPHTYIH